MPAIQINNAQKKALAQVTEELESIKTIGKAVAKGADSNYRIHTGTGRAAVVIKIEQKHAPRIQAVLMAQANSLAVDVLRLAKKYKITLTDEEQELLDFARGKSEPAAKITMDSEESDEKFETGDYE